LVLNYSKSISRKTGGKATRLFYCIYFSW